LTTPEEVGLSSAKGKGPTESMHAPILVNSETRKTTINIQDRERGSRLTYKVTKRFGIEFSVVENIYETERRFEGDQILVAKVEDGRYGPAGHRVAWDGLAKLISLTVSYAIPANRLAEMLRNSFGAFSSGQITRLMRYAATLLIDIYLVLAESSIAFGDDANTRVSEKFDDKPGDELMERLEERFGSVSLKKDGSGLKTKLNISFVAGQLDREDRRSWIFFLRTHVGSLGNLLSQVFSSRTRKKRTIKIQSDLSSANRLESMISQLFEIFYGGCASHARRPFWRYKEDDQGFCYFMLRGFALLAKVEKKIRAGRMILKESS
jgi:hypothetical protein